MATDWAKARTGPCLVLGDLNATPYSHRFRTLVKRGHLEVSAGVHSPTFPAGSSWPGSGVSIDHILGNRWAKVFQRRSVDLQAGSDHNAVFATIVLKPPR